MRRWTSTIRRTAPLRSSSCASALLAFCVLFDASDARAESALLWGFSAGGAIEAGAGEAARPRFRVGTGLDWLSASGFIVQSRLETTHVMDASFAALLGIALEGLRANEGPPLGLSLGPVVSLDRGGVTRAGGRGLLAFGLWYSRALLEADVTVRRRLSSHGDRALFGVEIIFGLTLRLVPWAPFRL